MTGRFGAKYPPNGGSIPLPIPGNPLLARVLGERRKHLEGSQYHVNRRVEQIARKSRVIIIEGISGSGKDTFQSYLRNMLKDRDVYDYSEGELLQSWKQLQIEGVFDVRVKLMKLFANHIRTVVNRDDNAVFLLNRFHLSTYASTIIRQPELKKEYDEIISILRTLPVHVFVLHLNEAEIDERSSHPERSTPWQRHQIEIAKKEGFQDAFERHLWQQRLILEAAGKQKIPYSVINFSSSGNFENVQASNPEESSNRFRSGRMNNADAKSSPRIRHPARRI